MNDYINELKSLTSEITVLYVEDEEDTQNKVKDILELFFKKTYVASNGQVGLELFSKYRCDLVISDLTMPVLNGIDMLSQIYKINPEQHVIITTAHNNSENLISTINMQVDGFLLKPIDKDLMLKLFYRVAKEIYREKEFPGMKHVAEGENLPAEDTSCTLLQKKLLAQGSGTVVFICIDDFDAIKTFFGNKIAKWLIKQVAAHLKEDLPDRWGFYDLRWNEFVLYIKDKGIDEINDEVQNYYEKRSEIVTNDPDGNDFKMTLSFGLMDGSNKMLFDFYDAFASQVKSNAEPKSFNVYKAYEEEVNTVDHYIWLKHSLDAIKRDEVTVALQPIKDLQKDVYIGFEAYARVNAGHTLLKPDLFLEPSKHAGILEDITKNVVQHCLSFLKPDTYSLLTFNVGEHLTPTFFDALQKELAEHEVPFEKVVLDIKQEMGMDFENSSMQLLAQMKQLGFKVAVENFENLSINSRTLFKLCPNFIKFNIGTEAEEAFIRSVILFANHFEMTTIATGIEDEASYNKAKSMGFDYGMGYYIGYPSPIDV